MLITEDAIVIEDSPFTLSVENPLGKIDVLLLDYENDKNKIEQLHDSLSNMGNAHYLTYLFDSRTQYVSNSLCTVSHALKKLDAEYWNKALRLTDIYELMPQNRKDEWNKSIDDLTIWEFERTAVIDTVTRLLTERVTFLAESVDHIFRNLSSDHITNVPEGFTKRMIMNYAVTRYSAGYYTTNYGRVGYLDDLRKVINKLNANNFDFRGYPTDKKNKVQFAHSSNIINAIINQEQFGQWISLDNDALKIKLFKKGTIHIEVNPEDAAKLNNILASLYPSAIPAKFRQKTSNPNFKAKQKIEKTINFDIVNLLLNAKVYSRHDEYSLNFTKLNESMVSAYENEIKEVMDFLGGEKDVFSSSFIFDYDPTNVIKLICLSSTYPCFKSYQFYPTPAKMVEMVHELACFEDGLTVLEPSAGHGSLIENLPYEMDINCFELSHVNASILQSKGFKVTQIDFMKVTPEQRYDRVVMNPPFTDKQAVQHVEHALKFLKPDGILVSVLPANLLGHQFCENAHHHYSAIYENEFDKTSVRTVIVAISPKREPEQYQNHCLF